MAWPLHFRNELASVKLANAGEETLIMNGVAEWRSQFAHYELRGVLPVIVHHEHRDCLWLVAWFVDFSAKRVSAKIFTVSLTTLGMSNRGRTKPLANPSGFSYAGEQLTTTTAAAMHSRRWL